MAKGQTLQDPFLNILRKEKIPVSIYLVNGIKLQGQVDSFDQFVCGPLADGLAVAFVEHRSHVGNDVFALVALTQRTSGFGGRFRTGRSPGADRTAGY